MALRTLAGMPCYAKLRLFNIIILNLLNIALSADETCFQRSRKVLLQETPISQLSFVFIQLSTSISV
jgi:hypothetical protein